MNTVKHTAKTKRFAFMETSNVETSRLSKNPLTMSSLQFNVNVADSDELLYHNAGSNNGNDSGSHFQQQPPNDGQLNTNSNAKNVTSNNNNSNFGRQRFTPYLNKRSYANALMQQTNPYRFNSYLNQQQQQQLNTENGDDSSAASSDFNNNKGQASNQIHNGFSSGNGTAFNSASVSKTSGNSSYDLSPTVNTCVTLQISNLDTTIEERELKQYLINRLKPITSVLSIYFESISVAKIKLPSAFHAKQVIAYLHRKKIGHKRITVSYTRESSSLEPSTLRCQVAGLLKDIPNYTLSMFKFRELFQSRFKTSISVVDLYEMKDICTIIENKNEDKFITLRSELIESIENSELIECLQHSVPYCTVHFMKTHRGWAEQDVEPLPNVQMNITQICNIIYSLLKNHKDVIPIASIVYCIQAELQMTLDRNESGVNFEHLISCVPGVQITANKFSIKILSWLNADAGARERDAANTEDAAAANRYSKYGNIPDSFSQVSREIVELIKLSPKSTLKFSRFIPAYHNHFGKQCRVADYGYTKLIDLFEALSSVVQVIGEGENRQITLTHKVQVKRFTSDLLRILRSQSSKSMLLSQLPAYYEHAHAKKFDITDYGVCDVNDMLDGLINNNVIIITAITHMMDVLISIPKRKQSQSEMEKTSSFAAEVVELFKHASQFTILFEKFACSYHYHFGYQCRLCDYGFLKLADLMEAIVGVVEMELSNEEDRKLFLSPKVAQRVFSEQLKSLIESFLGSSDAAVNLHEVLVFHKKQFGYHIMPQSLGFDDMLTCVKSLPYVEVITSNGFINIKCHHDDDLFRQKCYAACRLLLKVDQQMLPLSDFIKIFADEFNELLSDRLIKAMKHAIEIQYINDVKCVTISKMLRFIIRMISVIEPRGVMKIQELSNLLNVTINRCFPFGYPNLLTLIQAFPDIFVTNNMKPINIRSEVKLNGECILTNEGFSTYMKYCSVMNNNTNENNNNEATANNYNNVCSAKVVAGSSSSFGDNASNILTSSFVETPPSLSTSPGNKYASLSSLSMQSSFQTSLSSTMSTSAYIGPLEMNIHPIYENINTFTALNNISITEPDVHFPMHSTKIDINESFDSFSATSKNLFEINLSHNTSAIEDKENLFQANALTNITQSKLLNHSLKEKNKMRATEALCDLRSFSGKDSNLSHKPLLNLYRDKSHVQPTSLNESVPYWLDPIWSRSQHSPQPNLKIDLPDLKVFNVVPKLSTPVVMASIARKNRFSFVDQEN